MPRIKSRDRRIYIGVDPGMSGGLAAILPDGVQVTKMPATRKDVLNWLRWIATAHEDIRLKGAVTAVIEKVHAMPKQGVSSTFKFGRNYGELWMALEACGIRTEEVTPHKWQRALGIIPRKKMETKTQHKNKLKAKAQQLFPGEHVTLAVADALLLAEYCRRINK